MHRLVLRSLGEGGRCASCGVSRASFCLPWVLLHQVADQFRPAGEKTFPFGRIDERVRSAGVLLTAADFVQRIVVAEMIAHEDLHRLVFESFHAVEELLPALAGKTELAQDRQHTDIVVSYITQNFLYGTVELALSCRRIEDLADDRHIKRRTVKVVLLDQDGTEIGLLECGIGQYDASLTVRS